MHVYFEYNMYILHKFSWYAFIGWMSDDLFEYKQRQIRTP